MPREELRAIAYDWHGGLASPLYRFASHGAVLLSEEDRAAVLRELADALRLLLGYPMEEQTTERPRLSALMAYVLTAPIEPSP